MNKHWWLAAMFGSAMVMIGCGGGSLATPNASSSLVTASSAAPAPAPSSTSGGSTTPTSTPTSTSSTASTSAIPSTATVFDAIQDTTTPWDSCSDCAGGGSVTTSFWTAPFQSTPSLSGSSRQFHIGGAPWSNALWYHKLGAHNAATHMLWDFWVYFDSASAASAWSAEYDAWQSIAGQKFMIGSQCNFGDNHWDLWDSKGIAWIPTAIPCPRFTPNTWHHIVWDLERISSTQYRYNTLTVDDKSHSLGNVFTTEPTNWADGMGVQWQLDQNSSGIALNEWIDKVKLTIW